ncbi:MAG: GAF domain-containing sensor histidine kinase [Anaerolineae bacterium]|nr:GAF domain-containing sensor histidine kinase [Anaerolineae bacterium]
MHPRQTDSQEKEIATLQQTISTLEELLNISRRLNSTLEMRPLLQQIVESAANLVNADGASILLMEDSDALRFAAASGPESATLQGTEVPLDKSLAGWVATHGEMAIVENAQDDSRMYNIDAVDATQSIIAAPMLFGPQVIGVLEAVTTTTRHRFTPQDRETVATLAGVAAVAVQNARLFQQSDWVAEVVHEIRSPLTAILSYADLLRRPELDDRARERAITTIQQETERVSDLATQFLDLARLESGRITMSRDIIDVAALIDQAVAVIKPSALQRDRTVQVSQAERIPAIVGDKARLHQVLLNLLSNAVNYSAAGDVIDVEARMLASKLIISVSDTGPGIAHNQLPLLFQKFRRLPGSEDKARGTGLGLVVARQIVEAHRGQLWVESELGKGSCFFISLPVDGSR